MSLAPKNKEHWRPTATLSALKARAELWKTVRAFFETRGVLEVETPLLSQYCGTDVVLHPFSVNTTEGLRYLNTSPEFPMKRLIAAYPTTAIYQISKAFRQEESGKRHNPEFTMLEWYQPAYTFHDLIAEVDSLLQTTIGSLPAEKISYCDLFEQKLGFNPLTISSEQLYKAAVLHGLDSKPEWSCQDLLDLFMAQIIEPTLGQDKPIFITHYPAPQAALARLDPNDCRVALRFECYVKGIELANGYDELTVPSEQQERFTQDNQERQKLGLPLIPIDIYLLEALNQFPACSGVALGLDRLALLYCQKAGIAETHLEEVLTFPWERA